jgi:hypothetical protein
MPNSRVLAAVRWAFGSFLALLAAAGVVHAAVRIEVIRGDGANNNATTGFGISPAVRVLDPNGKPAPNALVVFTAPDRGTSVEFAGEGSVAQTLTDESGVAVAPHLRATGGNGPVEIRVMANVGAEFANTVIHVMNLGVGGHAPVERELTLVRLPAPPDAGPRKAPASIIALRLEDEHGHPVSRAPLFFVLRKLGNGRTAKEVSRTMTFTNPQGEALWRLPTLPGKETLELMVEAESEGRRVTDYFRLN